MASERLLNDWDLQRELLQRRPGEYGALHRAIQERRRCLQAELEETVSKLRAGRHPEQGTDGTAAADVERPRAVAWSSEVKEQSPRTGHEGSRPFHARYGVEFRVSVQCPDGTVVRGRTLDLSNSGVGATLSRRILPGTAISLKLHLGWEEIRVMGAVIWSDDAPMAATFGYRHGIRFRGDQPGTFAVDIFLAARLRAGR